MPLNLVLGISADGKFRMTMFFGDLGERKLEKIYPQRIKLGPSCHEETVVTLAEDKEMFF